MEFRGGGVCVIGCLGIDAPSVIHPWILLPGWFPCPPLAMGVVYTYVCREWYPLLTDESVSLTRKNDFWAKMTRLDAFWVLFLQYTDLK